MYKKNGWRYRYLSEISSFQDEATYSPSFLVDQMFYYYSSGKNSRIVTNGCQEPRNWNHASRRGISR